MGFYATDTLESAPPQRTSSTRARRDPACSRKPLRGPTRGAISGYRYYSPELGRWPSRDPIEEKGGLNLYTFCLNDPVDRFDPLGECSLIDKASFAALFIVLNAKNAASLGISSYYAMPAHTKSMPFQHCVWNCRMAHAQGAAYATQKSLLKEQWDLDMGSLGLAMQAKGCWKSSGSGMEKAIGHAARSAWQAADFADNATGRAQGVALKNAGIKYSDGKKWKCCEKMCEAAGVPPTTDEGPSTARPFGPLIGSFPEYNKDVKGAASYKSDDEGCCPEAVK